VKCPCCKGHHRNEKQIADCCKAFEQQAQMYHREAYNVELPADVEQKRRKITFFWDKRNPD
jgi:hypothetical protein